MPADDGLKLQLLNFPQSIKMHDIRHTGGAEVQLHSFLTLALSGGNWSASWPAHFGKEKDS